MTSNLLIKADVQENICKKNEIRTDFIISNVFSYLLRDNLKIISHRNEKEKEILKYWIKVIDTFRECHLSTIKSLCEKIDDISILLKVSKKILSEGITWTRIIAFFVFTGELLTICITKEIPEIPILCEIYKTFSKLVYEKIEPWVEYHNGWEGIKIISIISEQKRESLFYHRVILTLCKTYERLLQYFGISGPSSKIPLESEKNNNSSNTLENAFSQNKTEVSPNEIHNENSESLKSSEESKIFTESSDTESAMGETLDEIN